MKKTISRKSRDTVPLKYSHPPPTALLRMRGGTYMLTCVHRFVQPAIQAKYTYSTLLPAFLFGYVVYASATLVTDFTCSLSKHGTPKASPTTYRARTGRGRSRRCRRRCRRRRTPA